MNDRNPDIAMLLSDAPKPVAPSDLKNTLFAEASGSLRRGASQSRSTYRSQSWLRRWWPALAPASVSLACAVALTFQQSQVSELKERLQILEPSTTTATPPIASESSDGSHVADTHARLGSDEEIQQLRSRSAQLATDIAQLEQLRRENEDLRSQLSAASANRLAPDELRAIDDAKRRAERIACVNNLKQLGLAVRMWANDNDNAFPTNLAGLGPYLSNASKVLICPADTNRVPAKSFDSLTEANCSYDFYVGNFADPQQVITYCRIHSNVGLCDGSVQQITPDRLVEKDGKLHIAPRP